MMMAPDLPSQFQLAGRTITVKWTPDATSPAHGEYDEDAGVITIYSVTSDMAGNTFGHELVHAILGVMGRDDLTDDEAFVDLFGSLLYQAAKTAEP